LRLPDCLNAMFSRSIQCISSDQRLLNHDYRHVREEGKIDGLVLQGVFICTTGTVVFKDQKVQPVIMYIATKERSFWIVVGLNLCAEFAQLSEYSI